jgi:hypothetical protein
MAAGGCRASTGMEPEDRTDGPGVNHTIIPVGRMIG